MTIKQITSINLNNKKGNISIHFVLISIFFTFASSKIIYLTSIISNGPRYPKNDLYDSNQTKQFAGQITSIGLRQQYLLGTYIHQDYINQLQFISTHPNPKQIQILSSSQQLDKNSILAHIYGLFPVKTGSQIPEGISIDKLYPPFQDPTINNLRKFESNYALDLGFQPLPIYNMDSLINNCSKYGVLISKRYQQVLQNLTRLQAEHTVLIAKIKLVFNLSSTQVTIPTIVALYDTIICDKLLGRFIPKQITDQNLKEWKFINDYYFSLIFSDNFAKIISTPLISQIKENLKKSSIRNNNKKWSIFQGNQNIFMGLVSVLNLTSPECIYNKYKNATIDNLNCMPFSSFSANLIFQLNQDEAFSHSIKLRYNGQYAYLCGKQKTQCELSQFLKFLDTIMVDSEKYCNS